MLAIDVGSSWCKAALIDRQGRIVSEGTCSTRSIVPARDGALEAFWDAAVTATRAACAVQGPAAPAAIAISCRGLFGACLDHDGTAFWPAWNYGSIKTSSEVHDVYSADVWHGKDPFAHGYAIRLAGLVLWLRRHHPNEWRSIQRFGALHDYIVYRLTGQWVTDPTTGPEQAEWPDEILQITGLPCEAFPTIMRPEDVVSGLTQQAAGRLGLPVGTPVVTGFHDGAAANRGTGTVNATDACFTLGTNFVLRAVTGARLTSGCFCYTVAPGQWAWVNNVPSAATQLDVVATKLAGTNEALADAHGRLGLLAAQVPPGAGGARINLVPVEAISQLQAQVWALEASGISDGAIYRAMLEQVALGVRRLIARAIRDGAAPARYVATGGSARNRMFLSVLSAMIDAPIEIGEPEAGMIGAGMAAAVGAGWFESLDDVMHSMHHPGPVIQPETSAARYYGTVTGERAAAS